MSQNIIYTPLATELRQIRLLILLPALLSASTIKCELSVTSLDSVPEFEALSYVWGSTSSKEQKHIDLNRQKTSVTPNLHAALRALRLHRAKRVLWVDAVCINQADIPERNAQVAQMRHIYEAASDVAVWLGPEGSGSSAALAFVKTLATQFTLNNGSPDAFKMWLIERCVACSSAHLKIWRDLALLLSRPYWTRSWIYQELIVSASITVYCGRERVSWNEFETFAFAIDTHENALRMIEPIANDPRVVGVYHHLYNVALARSQRKALGFEGTPTLLEALCTHRSRNATDPKDKVFSLLGVTKNHFIGKGELPTGPHVAIDYSKSLSEVYKGVARHIMEKTGSLNVLCACQNPERNKGIPSWAPDWSTKRTNSPIMNTDQWGHIHFASGAIGISGFPDPPDDDTLVVHGVQMDTISAIEAAHEYGCDWDVMRKNWSRLADSCQWQFVTLATAGDNGERVEAEPCYITNQSISQAFFETLTFGRIDHDISRKPKDEVEVEMKIARIEAVEQRRFFITHSGFMGLGPVQAKVGDKVVVVIGVNVPLILREETTIERYAVVGEAYVHGLMDGLAVDENRWDALEETFGRRPKLEQFLLN